LIFSALMALAPVTFAAGPDSITTELPRVARPLHYDIALVPDAGNATFAGKVTITLDVLTTTPTITLNADRLRFRKAAIGAEQGQGAEQSADVSVDADKRTATFHFKRPLAKGRYRLVLDYDGIIGKQSTGLFSLDYDTPAGRKRALFTQFEDSDARAMIPCWDEPAYKATFTLEATVPADDMAVSNTPAAKTVDLPDGRKLVSFATTPKMSSYLLFFSMGEFDRATASAEGVELGVVMQKGLASQARFALDSSAAILHEYNAYFGVRYPLPKLDNIAGPGRGNFGAMENWGSIFTFEYNMLLDPAISTESDKERVFAVEAHEMAHQWFGDLVTMKWWDDLWLNEGFASWMEERTTARIHPEWNTRLAAVNIAQSAMNRDSWPTVRYSRRP
jgi:aminopeptidase N